MEELKAINENTDLFSTKVLSNELYRDINNVCKQDQMYKGIYLTSYMFGLFGYFASNKIYIQVGDSQKLTPKFGMLIVGSSQDGKTVAGNLILNPLRRIDRENTEVNEQLLKFQNACKAYQCSEEYSTLTGEELYNKKESFVYGWKQKHITESIKQNGYDFSNLTFTDTPIFTPSYIYSDFNLQTLGVGYRSNPKGTLLTQCDEFGTLIDQYNNGLKPSDQYEYVISSIDGKDIVIRRKTQEPIISKGSSVVITSTTHLKFESIKTTLFDGGLGNRLFYVITDVTEQKLKRFTQSTGNESIDRFRCKIDDVTRNLINFIQNCNGFTIDINNDNLTVFNDVSESLWNELLTEDLKESISTDIFNGMAGRFSMMLQQCILIVFMMNKFWNNPNVYNTNYWTLEPEDIQRGAEAYRYFLSNMLSIHSRTKIVKLSIKQQKFVDLFNLNECIEERELISRGNEARKKDTDMLADKSIRNFILKPEFLNCFVMAKNNNRVKYTRVA